MRQNGGIVTSSVLFPACTPISSRKENAATHILSSVSGMQEKRQNVCYSCWIAFVFTLLAMASSHCNTLASLHCNTLSRFGQHFQLIVSIMGRIWC
jgi:hypothetical protein